MPQYKIEKVILSLGLGGKNLKEIEHIRDHFENLFKDLLQGQKCVITKCKKSNAKFKIRAGCPMGLKVTLRKHKINKALKLFMKWNPSLRESWVFDSQALKFGIKDHSLLRLERYDYRAPVYGLGVTICFSPVGSRITKRRINPLKLSHKIDIDSAVNLVKQYVK